MLVSLLLVLTSTSLSKTSPWDTLSANIAVVELATIYDTNLSEKQLVAKNLQVHLDILEVTITQNKKKLDMIVFPESALQDDIDTSVEVVVGDNPCNDQKEYPKVLQKFSCAAKKFSTYLLINVAEKAKCERSSSSTNCKRTGYYFYNTNVVFDRKGTIISRYRKYNLFGELTFDRPERPEVVTFETDFGIKFGIFTCFDILFKSPAQPVLEKGVDAIVFLANWFSELPFLTALQTQQMFAYTHETMLFASCTNNPELCHGGSGIHRNTKDTILSTIGAKGGSQTLIYESKNGVVTASEIQDVDVLGKDMDSFNLWVDNSVQNFTWAPLNASQGHINSHLCHGKNANNPFCCNFNIKLTNTEGSGTFYSYLLVAFSGVRHYPNISDGGLEICGIIACLNSTIHSCGRRFSNYDEIIWPLKFENITIVANFEKSDDKTQFPNSLLSSIRPINANETVWRRKEINKDGKKLIERTFSLKTPQTRILTFAIYGRDFGKDMFPRSQSDGTNFVGSTLLLLTFSLTIYIVSIK